MNQKISQKFLIKLKLSEIPQYQIARQAGFHPDTLSKLIHGAISLKFKDPRIINIGKILGLKAHECFTQDL